MQKRDKFSALRERAEALLGSANPMLTEIQSNLNELDTYRIELELQNDELLDTHKQLQDSRLEYMQLYDDAPVGYCSINREGRVIKVNSTLAKMLKLSKEEIINHRFSDFILDADQDVFYFYRCAIPNNKANHNCELHLIPKNGAPFWVQIDNTSHSEFIMLAITNIHRLKTIEADLLLATKLILSPLVTEERL
jgi:PAS domain S-box-containing protein